VSYPGEIVTVEVTDASEYDLVGKVVARDPTRATPALPKASRAAPASGCRCGLPVVG